MEKKKHRSSRLDDANHNKAKNANKQIRGKKSVHMKTVTSPVTKKKKKKSTKTPEEYFVEIDLHKKFMQVAIMQSDGTVLENEKIECDYKVVEKKFAKFPDGAKYVIESSSVWYGMYKFLKEKLNLDVILSNPRSTKVIATSKKKTDKVDALILADLLRGGYIRCYA